MFVSVILPILKTIDYKNNVDEYIAFMIPKFVIRKILMQFSMIMIFTYNRFHSNNEEFTSLSLAAKSNLANRYSVIATVTFNKRKFYGYKLIIVKNKIVNLEKTFRSL